MNRHSILNLYLSILFLLTTSVISGQDSLKIQDNTNFLSIGGKMQPNEYFIESKNILFPFAHGNSIFRFLSFPTKEIPKIRFRKSFIGIYGESIPVTHENVLNKKIEFDSCTINYLNLAKLSGELLIINSRISVLYADSLTENSLRLIGNPYFDYGVILNSRKLKIDLQSTDYKDSAEIRIFNTSINEFNFGASANSGLSILFKNDTLTGFFHSYLVFEDSFFTDQGKKHKFKNEFTFSDCYIDADFMFMQEIPNSTFNFENCTFGPNAYLGYFWATQVNFRNCHNIPTQMPAGFYSRNPEALVSFINTDVDKLRMNFTRNMKLVFDTSTSKDAIYNSYNRLLTKFKYEGKPDSYKNVDLQYQKFDNSSFGDFLQRSWWYYGYRKYYVWYWTLGFLLFFYILNMIWWPDMCKIYPVITDYSKRQGRKYKRLNFLREAVVILVFTFYVFFSLRISLDKLRFLKIRLIAFFFLQYSIGLWCLYFIFRALLKF